MVCCVLAIRIMRDGAIGGRQAQRKENRGEAYRGPPRPRTLGRDPTPAGGHQSWGEGGGMKASDLGVLALGAGVVSRRNL